MRFSARTALMAFVPFFLAFSASQTATAQSLDVATCGSLDAAMQLALPLQRIRYVRLQMTQHLSGPNLTVIDGVSPGANGLPQGFDLRGFIDKVEQPSASPTGIDTFTNAPSFNLKFSGDTFHSPTGHYVSVAAIRVHYVDSLGAWAVDLIEANGQPIAGTGALGCEVDTDFLLQLASHSLRD